jgi:KDO2-lipid IV(A) lauroyltransferase
LSARGFPIAVVAQDVFEAESNRRLSDWRSGWGIRIFSRAHGLFGPARALREGWVVGTLVDQDTGGASVHREFFGRAARTTIAPFRLARRTGAALVPMWIHLGSDGRHRVTIRPALPVLEELSEEAAIEASIDAWHRELETAIAEAPAQWVWFHPRWKTPPGDSDCLRNRSKKEPYLQRVQASTETVIAR